MTRTPQWKAERAIRRARERWALAEQRRVQAEIREANKLRLAFDEAYTKMRANTGLGETKPLSEVQRG